VGCATLADYAWLWESDSMQTEGVDTRTSGSSSALGSKSMCSIFALGYRPILLTARRHVDFGRVRSAICPVC
jgi:hypothetical protein